jgi:hypothetical protein
MVLNCKQYIDTNFNFIMENETTIKDDLSNIMHIIEIWVMLKELIISV